VSRPTVRVALTFDAEHPDRPRCPPGTAERVLDLLAEMGERATFFLQGRWAEAYPDTARRIVEEGHVLGSHSHYHVRMPLLSDAGLESDLDAAEHAIRAATGVDPRPWFRCPWGVGADDARVLGALERAGYRHVGWDVVAEDWEPDRTAADVEEAVVGAALSRDRDALVLLHSWPASVPEALDGIVRRLREVGAELITVAEVPAAHLDATPNPGHVAGR
jgi:peptidoglycan/xylan/chitin deacetylase (PgdA/CDA1 family)